MSFFFWHTLYIVNAYIVNYVYTGFILLQAYKKLSLFMTILAKKNYDFFMTSAIFLSRGLMFCNDATH